MVWYPWESPVENKLCKSLALLKSPKGDNTPFAINAANVSRSIGVKNLPIISTTLFGLTVKINVKAKNIIENITGPIELVNGAILISKVVAPVLGIISIGPKQSIIITSKASPNFLPALPKTAW